MSDTYTGHVEVGGTKDVRRLPGLTIAKLAVGPMNNNAYLLRCTQTDEGLLVDAANEADRLRELVEFEGPPVSAVLTTHRHQDHWEALAETADFAGAAVYAGADDADELPVAVDERLQHGDTVTVGDATLEVIHLRGHTPGSVALVYRDPEGVAHLFTGDSLFPGGVGKTWSPTDFTSLLDDVEQRVFATLPDDTWFYPGHGDDSTLGAERPHLAEWRERGW
ncbi:Glyoxylase, beta-lactamase superfamily II [Jatrophihabitans endophyticus]|uniref:Glyoxylase, beta-lactamase superfamily II n=1 Tax=Jatrophihabitans endophyticus TaxID=1206085 RepID=A0A1M5MVZ4_9ACTN|nr:MBL fold metallo-hydrolase [Jatrophihabitans endophyticus]SHG81451.1 Glyoxylase, beta-lactamase superfamily II [Jatrophihabitans endophyticus]